MSGKPSEQEPSIEEILASIRQIISDDDEQPPAAPAPAAPKAAPAPPPPPLPPAPKDDILELTERVDEPTHMDEEPEEEADSEPAFKPRVEIDMRDSEDEGESILTNHAAGAALEGFMKLASSNMPVDRKGTGTVTLEDIVRELMRPMLREWLDVHLPPIIEKVVQKELDKIARKAVDE